MSWIDWAFGLAPVALAVFLMWLGSGIDDSSYGDDGDDNYPWFCD